MTHPLLEAAESYLENAESQADFLEVFAASPLWLPGEHGESPVKGKTLIVLDFKQLDDGYLGLIAFVEKPEISQDLPQIVEVSGSYVLEILSNAKLDLILTTNSDENKSVVYVEYDNLLLWRYLLLLKSGGNRSFSQTTDVPSLPDIEIFQKTLASYCSEYKDIQKCQLSWIIIPNIGLNLAIFIEINGESHHKEVLYRAGRVFLPLNIRFLFNPVEFLNLNNSELRNALKDPKTILYSKTQSQSWLGRMRRNFERVTVPIVMVNITGLE